MYGIWKKTKSMTYDYHWLPKFGQDLIFWWWRFHGPWRNRRHFALCREALRRVYDATEVAVDHSLHWSPFAHMNRLICQQSIWVRLSLWACLNMGYAPKSRGWWSFSPLNTENFRYPTLIRWLSSLIYSSTKPVFSFCRAPEYQSCLHTTRINGIGMANGTKILQSATENDCCVSATWWIRDFTDSYALNETTQDLKIETSPKHAVSATSSFRKNIGGTTSYNLDKLGNMYINTYNNVIMCVYLYTNIICIHTHKHSDFEPYLASFISVHGRSPI